MRSRQNQRVQQRCAGTKSTTQSPKSACLPSDVQANQQSLRSHRSALGCTDKPSGKRGRQQAYSNAAIQACLTIKVLFGLPLRQTTGFVESLLALTRLEWSVPDFSTLCRRQKTLPVAIPYRGSSGPLHLLIDSTGIKAEGEPIIKTEPIHGNHY